MDTTTPNIVWPTMALEVLSPYWQWCSNGWNKGPAVHREKNITHKTLETLCNAHVWPQQCWKNLACVAGVERARE